MTFAYVGPGAGFALLSSFFVLVVTGIVVVASLAAWPFRALWRAATRRHVARPTIRRLVIIGFDGQDPALTDRFMAEGRLPHFAALARTGAYRRLRTTFPSVSPVAWSSFSTGCEPARHNVFDFIAPDRRTYLPELSSTRIRSATRFFKIGPYRIPRDRAELRLLRKAKPFWATLGEHHIWSTILRVPITFPPDRFYGAQLSAMCVPDLLGTQGTFFLFTTRPETARAEGGERIRLPAGQDQFDAAIPGPVNPYRDGTPRMSVSMRVTLDRASRRVRLAIAGERAIELTPGTLSPWITLRFRAVPGITVSGLTRLLVTEMDEHFSLYVAPLNLDPERPAMPISHPSYYATYLAKTVGPFATMGLAEDTWALNEGVTDEATFLQQTYDIDGEREAQLMAGLDRLKRGNLVCVFDATDRIQHMFWRELDPAHPANRARLGPPTQAIRDLYEHNDARLGRVLGKLGVDDVLMVISDHGFSSFRRGINLNRWLHDEGYLALLPGTSGEAEWLREVDWTRTRAYAIGLTGLYLNLEGRERAGIVKPQTEAASLKAELVKRLSGLRDPESGAVGIREAFDSAALYSGPYLENAPDLLIGYNEGYRISWEGARGIVAGPVFQDNTKAWSGDHAIDPRLVPGVFFCNRPTETTDPALIDIAPTALRLFGIAPPRHMDGRPLANLP